MAELTSRDKQVARIMQDPALWAEHHLGAKPRWYQQQALRHPHNRTVLRWGRRLGKCIAEGQRMVDANTGEYIPVEELYQKGSRRTFSLDNSYKIVEEDMFRVEQNGIKKVYEVMLKNGAKVELTGNHPVLTIKGWTEVDDLQVGENIATPGAIPIFGKEDPTYEYVRSLAYLSSSTKRTKMGPVIDIRSNETRDSILHHLREFGLEVYPKSTEVSYIIDKTGLFTKELQEDEIVIPKEVFQYTEKKLAAFLAGIIDTKGYLGQITTGSGIEIGIVLYNAEAAKDLMHLFLRFGIHFSYKSIKRKTTKEEVTLSTTKKEELLKLNKYILPYSLRDFTPVAETIKDKKSYGYTIPKEINEYILNILVEKNLKKKAAVEGTSSERFRPNHNVSVEDLKVIANNLQDGHLYDIAHSDIFWEEVISITEVGEKMTYDVMMPKYHNLIIEDVCVHNTWTMTAHMLWAAFTNIGGTKKNGPAIIVVATPYDTQALLIYKQLMQFIENSEILSNSVKSSTKNPYNITFKNGAEIRLFTTGAKTSSGGASIRGQRADVCETL